MPMPAGISVGKDIVVQFSDTQNGIITVNRVKNWTSKQKMAARESVALDGLNRHINIPIGWEGSFEMERVSPAVDQYLYSLEQAYLNGQKIPSITITETITEANGAVSQYQYINVVIQLDSSGDWKGDDYVTQKVTFMAGQRNQLAVG
jgi:hypothetical protein